MNRFMLIMLGAILLAGCRMAPDRLTDPVEHFRALLDAKQFHAAFLMWPEVEKEMKDVPEGACGHEFNLMVGRTSCVGQKDWPAILMDRRIPEGLKNTLLSEIQENAEREMYDEESSNKPSERTR